MWLGSCSNVTNLLSIVKYKSVSHYWGLFSKEASDWAMLISCKYNSTEDPLQLPKRLELCKASNWQKSQNAP